MSQEISAIAQVAVQQMVSLLMPQVVMQIAHGVREQAGMQSIPSYLENSTAQPQDMPLQEEKEAMANRLQQRVQVGTGIDGTPVYKVAHGHDTQDLIVNCARILLEAGIFETKASPTWDRNIPLFGDYLASFQATYKKKLAPTTKETYRQLTQKHIAPSLGGLPLDQITTEKIQELYDHMVDQDLSLETIKKVRNIILPALDSAVEDKYIAINPAKSKRLKINTDKQGAHVALLPEEIAAVKAGISALPDDQRRLMALLCYTGQRIGEVLGLRWEDIDYDKKEIHIVRAVSYPDRNKPIVGKPKTKASQRTIPLVQPLVEALMPIQKEGFVVSGENPWSFAEERRRWSKLQKHFGIEKYTHHDFRDTCATDWLEAGIPIEVIARILGHADITTTDKHYIRTRNATLQNARCKMEEMTTFPTPPICINNCISP